LTPSFKSYSADKLLFIMHMSGALFGANAFNVSDALSVFAATAVGQDDFDRGSRINCNADNGPVK